MAIIPPGVKLGEARDAMYEVVSLAADVTAGSFLQVSGQEADGTPKVITQTTGRALYFATHDGKNGTYARVVCKGYVVGLAGSALNSGFSHVVDALQNEIVKNDTGTAHAIGRQWTKNAADGDTVLIWFDPRGSGLA